MSTIEDIQRIGILLVEANDGKAPKDAATNHLVQIVEQSLGEGCWNEIIQMYKTQRKRSFE